MDQNAELDRLSASLKLAKKRDMNVIGLLCAGEKDMAFYPSEYLADTTNSNGDECNLIVQLQMKRFLEIEQQEINIIPR